MKRDQSPVLTSCTPLRIVLIYAFFGALWIIFSDMLMVKIVPAPFIETVSIAKGWIFIALTALLLYLLIGRQLAKMAQLINESRESEERLRLLEDNLPDSYIYQYRHETDGTSRFIHLSAGVERIHGVSIQDVLRDAGTLHRQMAPEQASSLAAEEAASLENLTDFQVEVPICRTDGQWRWLKMSSCPRRRADGQVVWDGIATDITEQKQAAQLIERDELRLRRLVDILQHPSETVQGFLDYALDQAIHLTGSKIGYLYHYHEDRKEFVLNTWSREVMAECAVANPVACYELDKTGIWGEAVRQRRPIIVNDFQAANPLKKGCPEGHVKLLKFMTVPMFNGDSIVGVVGVANKETDYGTTDVLQVSLLMEAVWKVTERKQAEMRLRKFSRTYALLSHVNQTIVRVHDTKKLFEAACRIAVEQGGFRMAWVGLIDPQSNSVQSVAQAGETGDYLVKLKIVLDDSVTGRGPTATALRGGKYVVVNDIASDPRMSPWRDDALQLGYRASAAFPFTVAGKIRGTLNLYANESGFFDDEELHLLDEMVANIAFALEFTEQNEERNKAEAALRASEVRYHLLFDQSPDGIVIIDPDTGRFLEFNETVCRQLGYSREEFSWLSIADVEVAETPDDTKKRIASVMLDGRNDFETLQRTRQGEIRNIHVAAQYTEVLGRQLYYCVWRDITEHRRLEEQLRHAQKMESVGTLAGGIAHDFNNILTAIMGYGYLALRKMASDDPQRLTIEHMLEAADRAAQLTKDLLLFSRKQVVDRKSVNLNVVVVKVEKFLKRVIGEEIECKTELQEVTLPVLADAYQLEQVLMNLATNARDAMPHGGKFTVTTETVQLTEDFTVAHGFGKSGKYALITISDTGAGMDEETRQHIFEPFFTTKEVGKGTGLGLAVVYGIIKQHEGFINVYSEPGSGTTFRIYLPVIPPQAGEEARVYQEEAPVGGMETILLAEDDESVRDLTRTMLTEFGYTVIAAVDGEDAVRKFTEHQDNIDLLLFDLIMPKMNGKEAYDAIKLIRPEMKVIFSSGYAPDIIRQKASLEDGVHLLTKPATPAELLRKVRVVLDEGGGV